MTKSAARPFFSSDDVALFPGAAPHRMVWRRACLSGRRWHLLLVSHGGQTERRRGSVYASAFRRQLGHLLSEHPGWADHTDRHVERSRDGVVPHRWDYPAWRRHGHRAAQRRHRLVPRLHLAQGGWASGLYSSNSRRFQMSRRRLLRRSSSLCATRSRSHDSRAFPLFALALPRSHRGHPSLAPQ